MKISLNQKGIAHYIAPLAVIVLFAVGGTAYLVASHADSLTTYSATCSINKVPPTLSKTASMEPTVTVTNTGNGIIAPHMISFVSTNGGPTTYFKEVGFGSINQGSSASRPLVINYSPSLATSPAGAASVFSHSDLNFNGSKVFFQCNTPFTIQ